MPISGTLQQMKDHAERVFTWTVGSLLPVEDNSERPDYESELYQSQIEDVKLLRDVYGGTKVLRAEAETYLPQHPAEPDKAYERRVRKAVAYNALKRTVRGLTGMVFRKDPILSEDVPEVIAEHCENIDLQGRHIGVFARDLFQENMIDGHGFIHVEFPPAAGMVRNAREERESGIRPYWTHILKGDAINVRSEWVNGEPVLKLFVYRETATVPVGTYGEETVTRFRVLTPGRFEVFERVEDNNFVLVEEGDVSLNKIPVVPSYVNREGLYRSCPPLLDLAYENICHFQIRSDRQYTLALSGYPIMFTKGIKAEVLKLGPNWAIHAEGDLAEHADAKWIEPAGTSLEQVRVELKEIEARMASLGLQMLVRETRAAETAQAKLIDKSESDSALSAAARSLADSLENALMLHAEYLNQENGGSVIVNDDFRDQEMTEGMLGKLSDLVERNHLSLETLWERMQEGEVLGEDFDPELEQERIDEQDVADMVALAEARTQQRMNGQPPAGEPMMEPMV